MNIDLGKLLKIEVRPYIRSKGKWQGFTIHLNFEHQKTYITLSRKEAKKLIKDLNKWMDG